MGPGIMIPKWTIGKTARERLAAMAKAGRTVQSITHDHTGATGQRDKVYLIAESSVDPYRVIEGFGPTIHAAVADAYRKWKRDPES